MKNKYINITFDENIMHIYTDEFSGYMNDEFIIFSESDNINMKQFKKIADIIYNDLKAIQCQLNLYKEMNKSCLN